MGPPLLLLLGLLPLLVGPNWATSNTASQTSLQSASSGETTTVATSNPTVSLFTFASTGLAFEEPANAFADYSYDSHPDVDDHALWQPWSSAISVSTNASTTSSNDGSAGSELVPSLLVGPINDETSEQLSRESRSLHLTNPLDLTPSPYALPIYLDRRIPTASLSPFAFDDPFEDASAALDAWRQKQGKHGIGAQDTDQSNSAEHGKMSESRYVDCLSAQLTSRAFSPPQLLLPASCRHSG